MNNPILKATAKLVKAIRDADSETCAEAAKSLKSFADEWLVIGNEADLPGAGSCCLSDTDTTEAIREALEIWADTKAE